MPSNIKPKDFENYLPKETDSIASSIVKFAQFSILFWRWFRSEFTTTGELGYNLKSSMCETGCPNPDVVSEGSNDDEFDDDKDDRDPDSGGGGNPNPGSSGKPRAGCCGKYENYGRQNEEFEDEFGNVTVEADTDFQFYKPLRTNGVNILCDDKGNKQVGLKGTTTFQCNEEWVKSARMVRFKTGYSAGMGDSIDSSYDQSEFIRDGGLSGSFGTGINQGMWVDTPSDFTDIEVVIYGRSSGLSVPAGCNEQSKIQGYFQTNPGAAENEGSRMKFAIEPSGNWCVALRIHKWPLKRVNIGDGFSARDFKFSILEELFIWDRPKNSQTTSHKWKVPSSGYLTKIEGIRMCNLENQGKYYGGGGVNKPVQVGVLDELKSMFCFYDDRWQNEIPCYYPPIEDSWLHMASAWTDKAPLPGGGSSPVYQAGLIYPFSDVNKRIVTNRGASAPKKED